MSTHKPIIYQGEYLNSMKLWQLKKKMCQTICQCQQVAKAMMVLSSALESDAHLFLDLYSKLTCGCHDQDADTASGWACPGERFS